MEFEGKVWKEGKFWLIEIPALDVMTQGMTKKEALNMAQDATMGLVECYFKSQMGKDFSVIANDYGQGMITVTSNDTKLLLALSLSMKKGPAPL